MTKLLSIALSLTITSIVPAYAHDWDGDFLPNFRLHHGRGGSWQRGQTRTHGDTAVPIIDGAIDVVATPETTEPAETISATPTPDGTGTATSECNSTAAQRMAFKNAALADGVSKRVTDAFDFSCPDAVVTQTPISPVLPTSQQVDESPTQTAAFPTTTAEASTTTASPIGDYQLVWQGNDLGDFTTHDLWNPADACSGGYGAACMDPANVSQANGVITLNGQPCNEGGKTYCGAEVTTNGIKSFTNGYAEVTAAVSNAAGSFHAPMWFMGNGTGEKGWPDTGEIDVAEGVGTDGKMFMTLHWGGEGCPGGHCSIVAKDAPTVDASQMNTFGLERTSDVIRQYVNGKMTGEITRAQVAAIGGNYDVLFNSPMHFRADKAAGGVWASPNGGTLGAGNVQIKDLKFYE